jgi:hypothetical protein
VTPAPVFIACATGGKPLENWSGREDSNLRPLPPEGVAPERIRCFPTAFPRRVMLSDGQCSFLVHGRRFKLNLGPCLYGGKR